MQNTPSTTKPVPGKTPSDRDQIKKTDKNAMGDKKGSCGC
jgi:hypothetical protein